MNKILYFSLFLLFVTIGLYIYNFQFLGASDSSDTNRYVYIVQQNFDTSKAITELKEKNYIKNEKSFRIIYTYFSKKGRIESGGYYLYKHMNSWQILRKITSEPDFKWVKTTYCLRKEQVGEIIGEVLGWNDSDLKEWNNVYSDVKTDYYEGVYYPDTYLLPVAETPSQIAQRYIVNFNEKIGTLSEDLKEKNTTWTTALKIASLIGRESAGEKDRKIVSGIIWNRLNIDMALQIDATMQYTLGKNEAGKWWGAIDIDQKKNDSPYNSYKHKGLPPTPICSPNLADIEAAVNPVETDCLFYLHDRNKKIHCAQTYTEHLKNIQEHLRN